MIPPRSFVRSVYCASPDSDLVEVVREQPLEELLRARALDLELAHVRDVEDAGVGPHRAVLGDDALVLDGHLPARERDEPRAERGVPVVKRRAEQRLHADSILVKTPSGDPPRNGVAPAEPERRTGSYGRRVSADPLRAPPSTSRASCETCGSVVAQERRHFEHVVETSKPSRRARLGDDGGLLLARAAPALRPEPGRDHRHAHLVAELVVDHRAEDHVGVLVGGAGDDLGRLVDLEEPDVRPAR